MANLSDITNSSGQSFNSGSKPPRRGGAGGHSTKMTVKPKKNKKKKKSTPKPAPVAPPKKKVDNSLGEPTEKPTGSKVYTLGGKLVEDTLTIAKPPKPKPVVAKKKVDTLTRQEKKLDPTPKVHSTPKPKPSVPKKRVDTLTRQEKKLDPTPKPKTVVTKKKANPKGGKPMIEQKLITKGNNVATDVKKAADDRGPTPTKYNQEYWAKKVADGVSQADLAAEQKTLGIKKAYSGDKVVTKANADTAAYKLKKVTGSDATLQNGGVSKTTEKGGLFGEKTTTKYDYKGGPKITTKATDPVIGGVRLGDKKSTTYVDGVEYATKTGHDPLGYDAKVTKPKVAGHITDTVKVGEKTTTPATTTGASRPAQATAGSGAPALASVQPDNLTNVLAIKKNKRSKGKRGLVNKRKGAGLSFGAGGTGLNIPT